MFKTIMIDHQGNFEWLFNWRLNTQKVDNLHHAPGCEANHFHRMRLVFKKCSCGANTEMRPGASDPRKRKHYKV